MVYTGAMYGSGRASALLLPRCVLPDARHGHPTVHLRIRRVSHPSQA